MDGIGPPLVTPFDTDGAVDHDRLATLVDWVEDRGVDFVVPCGSTSEAELLTPEERGAVIETVVEAASVPVIAGTGAPGQAETLRNTAVAADAGADAALVVTPFYYNHDQATLEAYYREVADVSPLPVYLYSVPMFTGVKLTPKTVGALADHPNVVGMKDSSGDVAAALDVLNWTDNAAFDLVVGAGGVLAPALAAGATGGILAIANLVPTRVREIYTATQEGDPEQARAQNADLLALKETVIGEYGIPGLKWAMRERGAPAGHPRSPHQPLTDAAVDDLNGLLDDL